MQRVMKTRSAATTRDCASPAATTATASTIAATRRTNLTTATYANIDFAVTTTPAPACRHSGSAMALTTALTAPMNHRTAVSHTVYSV